MKAIDYVLQNDIEVLKFLKGRYPLYHLSNVFFRDIQYGIQTFLEGRKLPAGYSEAEKITQSFVAQLEKKKILSPIDKQSWLIHYEEFRKPAAKPAAPAAKPAPSAPAAPRPAGGLPPLKGATPTGATRPAGGLPPLKSAAKPATPVVAPVPAQPAVAEPAPIAKVPDSAPAPVATPTAAPAPSAATGKVIAPLGKRPLPPIKSSKPAGS